MGAWAMLSDILVSVSFLSFWYMIWVGGKIFFFFLTYKTQKHFKPQIVLKKELK